MTLLVVALTLALAGVAVHHRRRRSLPPRWDFTGCWIEPSRVVAEGLAAPGTLVFAHFCIEANGRSIEMVVMELVFGDCGPMWAARDLASLKASRVPVQ